MQTCMVVLPLSMGRQDGLRPVMECPECGTGIYLVAHDSTADISSAIIAFQIQFDDEVARHQVFNFIFHVDKLFKNLSMSGRLGNHFQTPKDVQYRQGQQPPTTQSSLPVMNSEEVSDAISDIERWINKNAEGRGDVPPDEEASPGDPAGV